MIIIRIKSDIEKQLPFFSTGSPSIMQPCLLQNCLYYSTVCITELSVLQNCLYYRTVLPWVTAVLASVQAPTTLSLQEAMLDVSQCFPKNWCAPVASQWIQRKIVKPYSPAAHVLQVALGATMMTPTTHHYLRRTSCRTGHFSPVARLVAIHTVVLSCWFPVRSCTKVGRTYTQYYQTSYNGNSNYSTIHDWTAAMELLRTLAASVIFQRNGIVPPVKTYHRSTGCSVLSCPVYCFERFSLYSLIPCCWQIRHCDHACCCSPIVP